MIIIRRARNDFLYFYRIGLKRLDITLDHPQQVYYGGKYVTGKIYLELQAPTTGLGE